MRPGRASPQDRCSAAGTAAHAADPGDGRDPVPVPGTPRVPEEKGNPRCLRRLWQETQDAIRVSVDQLVVQAFDQMMEAEQFSVGWDAGKGVGMM